MLAHNTLDNWQAFLYNGRGQTKTRKEYVHEDFHGNASGRAFEPDATAGPSGRTAHEAWDEAGSYVAVHGGRHSSDGESSRLANDTQRKEEARRWEVT